MIRKIRAVYRDGVFCPERPCDLPENSEVELFVQGPSALKPAVTDQEQRDRILREIVERMQGNPLPPGAPRWTRDELHERR